MRKLRATLRCLTELAVLPEAYREDLRSTLNFDDAGMRRYGEYHADLLLSELEKCGLNLVFVNCYLHKRYAAISNYSLNIKGNLAACMFQIILLYVYYEIETECITFFRHYFL